MRTRKKKWTVVFFALCCSCGLLSVFYSCEQSDEYPLGKTEEGLNLMAPSGEKIATDVVALKRNVADFISERYGVDKVFEIEKLQYLPVNEGYSVLIDYKTADGIVGNLGITSNCSNVTFETNSIMSKTSRKSDVIKTRGEADGGDSTVTYSCKTSSKSPKDCSCKLTVRYHEDTAVYEYSCKESADNCECELTTTYK